MNAVCCVLTDGWHVHCACCDAVFLCAQYVVVVVVDDDDDDDVVVVVPTSPMF